MEIIAMGELREYLTTNLPNFTDPVIFISSEFIPGCPMCSSSTSVYYIKLTEHNLIPHENNIEKVQQHKFPIDVYVQYAVQKQKPKKIVIGTKRTGEKLTMILKKIID
jgi:hypothetical protein